MAAKNTTIVVDVVAAARQLLAVTPHAGGPGIPVPEFAGATGSVPLEVAPAGVQCQFGHANPLGGKFCPECGLPTGREVITAPVHIELPKPENQLTPEERTQRELQHRQALAANAALEAQPLPDFQPSPAGVTIHFVDDGFTAFGNVWLRGQQLSIAPDHPQWEYARSWITLTAEQQMARYGKHYFSPGPQPYQEGQAEQFAQVEGRRLMRRMRVSAMPDEKLFNFG